jgi:hypothetical protein
MNTGGEAAEQIVRMSLEGFEVAAKITGAGAKNIAILLYSILKEEKKTKGKARLTNMLRSGKELKVFTVKRGDLQKFTQEAKKYGVLYCVLADRKNKDPNAEVDCQSRGRIENQPYRGTLQPCFGGYRIHRHHGGKKQGCKGRSARARNHNARKGGERQAHGCPYG